MAQSSPLMLRLVASSVSAASRAGKIIRDIMSEGELGIIEKGKNDLQTEADRSAQRCIIASLARQYPTLTIIGEEGASNTTCEVPSDWVVTTSDIEALELNCPDNLQEINEKDIVIWVDPLDGTSEYTKGLVEHVTVLIGIAVKGRAVAGVIHQPYGQPAGVGRTLWGILGAGVGGFTPIPPPKDRMIVTTTRSHSNQMVEDTLNALKPDEVLKVGGAGHKVMLLLEGKANAYVFASSGMKKWDTCAPEAILTAIGGQLTDLHGKPYTYDANVKFLNSGGVIATAPGENHSFFVKAIPENVKSLVFVQSIGDQFLLPMYRFFFLR